LEAAKAWIEKQTILERRDLAEQIAFAEQGLLQRQTNLDRSKKLFEKGFVPETQLTNEEFALGAAKRKLDSLKRRLDEFSTVASGNSAKSQPDSNSGETTSDENSEANQPTGINKK
jgi:multidrug resistance efflux pump